MLQLGGGAPRFRLSSQYDSELAGNKCAHPKELVEHFEFNLLSLQS